MWSVTRYITNPDPEMGTGRARAPKEPEISPGLVEGAVKPQGVSFLDRVKYFFISSDHPSKLEKYNHILAQYTHHLGGEQKIQEALQTLERTGPSTLKDHTMNALRALLGEGEWAGKNSRERYQDFVKELRAAIETPEYQEQRENLNNSCVKIIQDLVKIRWFESEMYSHLEKSTNLFISPQTKESIDGVNVGSFSETFKEANKGIKNAHPELRKRQVSLLNQRLQGMTGAKDFSGTENIPFIRCQYDYNNEDTGKVESIKYMRHSRPTVGGSFLDHLIGMINRIVTKIFGGRLDKVSDGETIASDYEEAIRIAKDQNEAIFYVVHQRRATGIFENEGDGTKLIEELDEKHDNFHVLVQSVQGPLFERKKEYKDLKTMDELKTALINSFGDSPDSPNRLPNAVRDNYYYLQHLEEIFDEVKDIFFPDVDQPTQDQWEQMILLFYVFQKDDLKFRLNGDDTVKYYTTPCKDFLDRGGNMALIEDMVHYYMANENPSPEDLKHTLYTTLGTPILVKKTQVVEHHIERGLKIVDLLATLSAEKKGQLRAHRFHDRSVAAVNYPAEAPN